MTMTKSISYDHGARIAERARQNNPWNEPAATPSAAAPNADKSTLHLDDNSAPTREASIILPLVDNFGEPALEAHANIVVSLLAAFSGFTEETVKGQWCDVTGKLYRDESVRYTVAAPSSSQNQNHLEAIARQACADAGQICLYMRGFDGVVRFVKP